MVFVLAILAFSVVICVFFLDIYEGFDMWIFCLVRCTEAKKLRIKVKVYSVHYTIYIHIPFIFFTSTSNLCMI